MDAISHFLMNYPTEQQQKALIKFFDICNSFPFKYPEYEFRSFIHDISKFKGNVYRMEDFVFLVEYLSKIPTKDGKREIIAGCLNEVLSLEILKYCIEYSTMIPPRFVHYDMNFVIFLLPYYILSKNRNLFLKIIGKLTVRGIHRPHFSLNQWKEILDLIKEISTDEQIKSLGLACEIIIGGESEAHHISFFYRNIPTFDMEYFTHIFSFKNTAIHPLLGEKRLSRLIRELLQKERQSSSITFYLNRLMTEQKVSLKDYCDFYKKIKNMKTNKEIADYYFDKFDD